MKVPFLDLRAGYLELKKEIDASIKKCLDGGWYVLGGEVLNFEKEFAAYCGVEHCIGVGNGLDALELLLLAYGIGSGDEVIVPANTYIATILAISEVGAKPVLVDPDPISYNINTQTIKDAISSKTKAILTVHLYGQMSNMTELRQICDEYELILLEDAAQAHGATHHGRPPGSIGDGAGFSFYPGKNLGAYGDGGMIATNNSKIADFIKIYRNYGSEKKYFNSMRGCNSRLDEIQASILRVKLQYLDEWNNRRAKIAEVYTATLSGCSEIVEIPQISSGNIHCWHLYVVKTKRRKALMEYLSLNGVDSMIHYPLPAHLQKAFEDQDLKNRFLPVTEKISEEIMSLPIGPHMSQEQAEYVCKVIKEFK